MAESRLEDRKLVKKQVGGSLEKLKRMKVNEVQQMVLEQPAETGIRDTLAEK